MSLETLFAEARFYTRTGIERKGQTRFVQMTESDKECSSLARALCKKSEK